jgi:hypothetical protein
MAGVAELKGKLWERLDDKMELCGHPTSRTSCPTTSMTVLSYHKSLRVDELYSKQCISEQYIQSRNCSRADHGS